MERQVLSRSEARACGATKYFTGKACKWGHVSERYTNTASCVACEISRATIKNKLPKYVEWKKQHYRENKERLNALSRKYQEDNKAELAERAKIYRQQNKEKFRDRNLAYREKNGEYLRQRDREEYKANREAVLQKAREDRHKYRARDNALSRTKKAHKIKATPAWADMAAIKAVYAEAAQHGHHVDHIIPLRSKLVCGLHVHENLRPLEPGDNMRKHNRFDPDEHVWEDGEWIFRPKDQ